MQIEQFETSLRDATPPPQLSPALQGLWLQRRGDWTGAHQRVQDEDDAASAWVHAHLHRVEGDCANAGYWYRRAGKPVCRDDLDHEWRAIVATLLAE